MPLILLADKVRETGFKVVLTGEGADEVFAGYDIFKEGKIRRFWARHPDSTWRPQLLRRLYGYLANSPVSRGALASGFFGQSLGRPDVPYFAHRPRWAMTNRALRLLTPEFRERIDAEHPINLLPDLAPGTAIQGAARLDLVRAAVLVELRPQRRVRVVVAESGRELPPSAATRHFTEEAIGYYQGASDAFRRGALRRPGRLIPRPVD